MKRLFILFISLTACFLQALHAQYHQDWSVFLGVANYQGDLPEPHVELLESRLTTGLIYRWHGHDHWTLRTQLLIGRISGDDRHANNRSSRKFRFSAPLIETALMVEWKPFVRESNYFVGQFRPHIGPYLFVGVGVTWAPSKTECYREGMPPEYDPFAQEMKQSWFLALPIGVGMRFDVHPDLSIGLEVGQRPVFSDLLDGVSVSGNPDRDDWYLFSGVTFSWVLGSRTFRDVNAP